MMWEGAQKIKVWVMGTSRQAMSRLSTSATKLFVGTPSKRQANTQGNSVAVAAGKVAWPVDEETHDGIPIIAADKFLAWYDSEKREVWMLDDHDGTRHPGAEPLEVGRNVTIHGSERRSGMGEVIRTAEYGTAGLDKNVFHHYEGDIIAHHRDPEPPKNSTMVRDPGEGDDDWEGGLHYLTRVRKWIAQFCQGATTTGGKKLFAALLNFSRNGDGTVAHGAAHFDKAEACLSYEASGPLRESAPKHKLGETEDAQVRAGAINIEAYFSGGDDDNTGPLEFEEVEWTSGKDSLFVTRPRFQYDSRQLHDFNCGKRRGEWKIYDTAPMQIYDPPIIDKPPREDDPPPTEGPPPPPPPPGGGDPPPSPGEPASPSYLPYKGRTTPSVASPAELEAPSKYAHPRPGVPDDPGPTDWPGGGYSDTQWMRTLGYTDKQWNQTPFVGHEDSMPVYETNVANDKASGPADRWPTVKSDHEILIYGSDGRVIGRDPALGPGSVIDMPSNMNASHALATNDGMWPAAPNDFARIVFSAKNNAGIVADGRIGLGRRVHTSPYVTSGWEAKLDFTDSTTEPHIDWISKDASGSSPSAGEFRINGVAVGTGSGDVVGPASSTDSELALFDGTTGKLLKGGSGITGPDILTKADNLSGIADAGAARSNIGAGTGDGDMLASNNLSDLASDDTAIKNLIGGATVIGAPALADKTALLDVTGATTGGYITLQGIFDQITNLSAGTPILTSKIAGYLSGGKSFTPQAIYNLINSLTAETAPVYNDKLPLYDASASQTDAVTIANLFGDGRATVISYSGSGSSGKTVTLTGINRAHYMVIVNKTTGGVWPTVTSVDGATGSQTSIYYNNGNHVSVLSLNAPAAGTAQTLTINSTAANWNTSGNTYHIFVVGTPT